jgi:endonuclease/exonuclease/phosphatase (EEP) superfamily protein YafD
VVFLAVVVLVRAIAWDRWSGFTELDAGIEVLYLPAWVVLIACVFGRRWWLAGAAALICVAQVIYVAPELLASTPVPAAVRSEPTFRLFDANVDSSNRSMAGYITQLKAYHPDVITMEETQQYDYEQLEASGVFADLPYRYNFESLPLHEAQAVRRGGPDVPDHVNAQTATSNDQLLGGAHHGADGAERE